MKITAAQATAACRKIIDEGKARQKAAADAVKTAKADLDKATDAFLKEASTLLRDIKPSQLKDLDHRYASSTSLVVMLSDTPETRQLIATLVGARKPYSDCVNKLDAATRDNTPYASSSRGRTGNEAYQLRSSIDRAERALKVLSLLDPAEKVSLGSTDFRFLVEGLS